MRDVIDLRRLDANEDGEWDGGLGLHGGEVARIEPKLGNRTGSVKPGALGAYHIGAYQALAEHGFEPDWFSGISIGAINSAVLAGTPPAERVARLEELWRLISWPEVFRPLRLLPLDILHNTLSNAEALVIGQPHFFRPRPLNPYFAPAGPPTLASFYDTTPMLETLRRLVDFDLINAGPMRLTLGATEVETGQVVFFDSANAPEADRPGACAGQRLAAARLRGHGDRRALLLGRRLRLQHARSRRCSTTSRPGTRWCS